MRHEGFTAAPWVIDREWRRVLGSDRRATIVCELGNLKVDETDANARLIADAPALLAENERLRALLADIFENGIHHFTDNNGWKPTLTVSMYERVRAALKVAP